ncbi:hypothetical protein E4U61_003726 [Claviceps capensis]|nr:hypothetical protein E4U61_003726 [Claviceps capensis]
MDSFPRRKSLTYAGLFEEALKDEKDVGGRSSGRLPARSMEKHLVYVTGSGAYVGGNYT